MRVPFSARTGRRCDRWHSKSCRRSALEHRWRNKPRASPQFYVHWKGMDNIEPGLIDDKEFHAASNSVLADYDALDLGKEEQSNGDLAPEVEDRLNDRIGATSTDPKDEIVAFTIQRVNLDANTRQRLNSYSEQDAMTRSAQEGENTAEAEARSGRTEPSLVRLARDSNVLLS